MKKGKAVGFDRNDFFRQATMRICGDLDIKVSLGRCLDYLEKVFPLTGMALHLLDDGFANMRTIAHVTHSDDNIKLDDVIHLPKAARTFFERKWAKMPTREVAVINRPELDPVVSILTQSFRKPNASIMVMRLRIENNRLGSLVLYKTSKAKKNQYSNEHAHLLSLLHDPFSIAMSNALKHGEVLHLKDMLADDVQYLHQELLRVSGDEIIGKNGGLKRVMEMVRQVASLKSPVLLLGETGTGKEVIANTIHYSSIRRNGPFIKVNCGAIPDSLVDSELFGHEKGAFTGATARKRGRFERAHQGTIFLDEIGDLPLHAQSRLLRVLQNKEIERVGGSESISVDVRIISATHRHLEDMVNSGQFREDLWFRLNVFPITIPPLRQRQQDLPALVDHFIKIKAIELKYQSIPAIAPGAMDKLISYRWPGNVRELENVVERALIQNRGQEKGTLLIFDPFALQENNMETLIPQSSKQYLPTLDEMNSIYIQKILTLTKGKIKGAGGAAERLGINPSTLRSRMKKLGIKLNKKKDL